MLVGLVLDEGEFFAEALRDQVEDSFRFNVIHYLIVMTINSIFLIRINDVVALLAWKDAAVLDDINKIYTAKYNSDLEEDLLSVSDTKHHPVIQVRDGQEIFRNEKVVQ